MNDEPRLLCPSLGTFPSPAAVGFYGKLGFLRMNTAMAIWHNPAPAIESGLLSAQP
jgi:hypothetical protein